MIKLLVNSDNIRCTVNIILVSFILFYMRFLNFEIKQSIQILNCFSIVLIALEVISKIFCILIPTKSDEINLKVNQKGDEIIYKSKKSKLKIISIIQVICQSFASIVITHITIILFGSYFIQNFEETLTFSFLVSTLVFIRPLISIGPSAALNIAQDWHWSNSAQVQGTFVLIGSWLGAFLIPLDWDRPWQVWPLTCCFGALLGELTASVILLYDRLRRFKKVA